MSYANLTAGSSDLIVLGGSLHIPGSGLWVATIEVDTDQDLRDQPVTLTVADLSLVGHVTGGSTYQEKASLHLVGGFGGWRRVIPAKGYRTPLTRLATIVGDAAQLVGEVVRVEADKVIGPYSRFGGPASVVLQLAASYYVEPDGTTVIGVRPSPVVSPRILSFDPRVGAVAIDEEEVATLLPGTTIDVEGRGSSTVLGVTHNLAGGTVLHI